MRSDAPGRALRTEFASTRGESRGRWPRGVLAFAVVLCAALLGCATAGATVDSHIRVLLHDGPGPLRAGPAAAPSELRALAGTLTVDGRTVGSRWVPDGRGPWRVGERRVRGRIAVEADGDRVRVLNRVGIEDYVSSIVGAEMSPSWPREALRAQAVASRTYALHEAAKRRSARWDVRATSASQVYRGIAAETEETRAAARATRGVVLTHRGRPILAVFHSTAGGRTATAGEVWGEDRPYLQVVEVEEEDDAPHTYWRTVISRPDLGAVLDAHGIDVGEVQRVAVTRRTASGRVARLEIRGSGGVEALRGRPLKGLVGTLGLRSTLFDVRSTDQGLAFVGSGYGHGVGMSQWGARAMAERGAPYQRILARFYPGARLEKWKTQQLAGPVSAGGRRGEIR